MKKLLSVVALTVLAQSLTGCIVEPAHVGVRSPVYVEGDHYRDEGYDRPGGWCGERRHCR